MRRLLRERELARLATRQHGVLARRQLVEAGLGHSAIDARVNSGRLHVVHRGVYSVGHREVSLRGRWMAAVLAGGEGALLSHRSAAALWALMRQGLSPVDVAASRGRQGRKGIRLHRMRIHPKDQATNAGIPVTSVARTLVDLAEILAEDRLKQVFEEADRLKLLAIPTLIEACARAGHRKGLPALRRLTDAARDPVTTDSPLEDRFLDFCRVQDLPVPATNALVLDYAVDAFWPKHRLVIELDGFGYHGHRAAFERDRARDAALQAAGYRVIRLTHRQLNSETPRIATQLHKLLGADRRHPVR